MESKETLEDLSGRIQVFSDLAISCVMGVTELVPIWRKSYCPKLAGDHATLTITIPHKRLHSYIWTRFMVLELIGKLFPDLDPINSRIDADRPDFKPVERRSNQYIRDNHKWVRALWFDTTKTMPGTSSTGINLRIVFSQEERQTTVRINVCSNHPDVDSGTILRILNIKIHGAILKQYHVDSHENRNEELLLIKKAKSRLFKGTGHLNLRNARFYKERMFELTERELELTE